MRQGKCGWARRRKWRYLDGTLPAPQKRQVEAHLQGCLPCRAEFTRAQDALNALATGKPLTPEQQRALQRPKSGLTPSRAAAVAILALLLSAGVYWWRVQGAALLERLSARGAPAAAVAESAVAAPTPAPSNSARIATAAARLGVSPDFGRWRARCCSGVSGLPAASAFSASCASVNSARHGRHTCRCAST